jgi:hypothetical protein
MNLSYNLPEDCVLLLKTVDKEMCSKGTKQFKWPTYGPVIEPDPESLEERINELNGLLWGINGEYYLENRLNYKWLVIEVKKSDLIPSESYLVGGVYRFRSGTVVFCGDMVSSTGFMSKYAPENHNIVSSIRRFGDYGKVTTGFMGTSISGKWGFSKSGNLGTSISDDYGRSISGEGGLSIVGRLGYAASGKGGTISVKYIDKDNKIKYLTGNIGNGLKEDTEYGLTNSLEFKTREEIESSFDIDPSIFVDFYAQSLEVRKLII